MPEFLDSPWRAVQDHQGFWSVVSSGGTPITDVALAGGNDAAHARLLAVAPELLAVARFAWSIERDLRQQLCQCDEAYCAYCSWLEDLRQAINKVEGIASKPCELPRP